MKYLSKINITVFATFSILLLILTSFVLCNPTVAHYKTRITVDTVDLKITPYQPVNTVVEEISNLETTKTEEEIPNLEIDEEESIIPEIVEKQENLEENNSLELSIN